MEEALCHPVVIFIQIQGCVILFGLALGWLFATFVRFRALCRVKAGETVRSDDVTTGNREKVSVVLPAKGIGQHSVANWKSQLESEYNGALEFIFVVESAQDCAYEVLLSLKKELKDNIDIQVIISGQAWKCSQKIHNQLAGVKAMAVDSDYVLFLDDDIRIYPSTISTLVTAMEEDPKTFLVTGYPFDIPSNRLASYCCLDYHLPLFIGFSTGGTTTFVWGGCMLFHATDFREDRYGLVSVLGHGGYSDDMTMASIAGKHGRRICVPDTAVFIHHLASDLTMAKYWNYMRRQIYVLETYHSLSNCFLHRVLLLVHCWLSWGLVFPIIPSVLQFSLSIRNFLVSLSPTSALSSTSGQYVTCIWVLCVLFTWAVLYLMTWTVLDLCTALDPKAPEVPLTTFKWNKMFMGITIGNFVYPICALCTWLRSDVEWSGVIYSRQSGKIDRVFRPSKEQKTHFRTLGPKSVKNSPFLVWVFDLFSLVTDTIKSLKVDR